jgi:hypothetical protein
LQPLAMAMQPSTGNDMALPRFRVTGDQRSQTCIIGCRGQRQEQVVEDCQVVTGRIECER